MVDDEASRHEKCLDLFAELASIATIDDLDPSDTRRLRTQFRELFPYAVQVSIQRGSEARTLGKKAGDDDVATERKVGLRLKELHRLCKKISTLVDGGYADLESAVSRSRQRRYYKLETEKRRLKRYIDVKADYSVKWHAGAFYQYVSPLEPFLFDRCPACQQIFVARHRNQRYCSAQCRHGSVKPRGDNRREYFREYMRARRAQQKAEPSRQGDRPPKTSSAKRAKRVNAKVK